MFDNPRTTIFLLLTAIFCLLVAFTPVPSVHDIANFDVENITYMVLAVVSIILAVDALFVVFLGATKSQKAITKLKKQLTFNKIISFAIFVYVVAMGIIIYLNNLLGSPNHEWAFPVAAFITNILAGNSIGSDIKTLKSEDRLR